jgi:hypothetical protein
MSQVSSESEYQFQSVILSIPEKDIEIDISQTIMELTLFESVNIPYITGNMVCVDTQFAFEELRMNGTERLKLSIVASEYDYTFEKNFIITRTIGKTKMNESGYGYNFYIAEEIFFLDVLKKVSNAYQGTPSQIIQSVLSSEFDKELDLIGKPSAQSAFTYISPFISPLTVIETIRKRTSDRNGYPFFVYATLKEDSVRMKCLSDMIETDPINRIPFTFSNAQNYNPDRKKQLTNIEFMKDIGTNDTVEMLMKGAVQNQYNVLNLSTNRRNKNNRFNITEVIDAKDDSIYNKDLKIREKTLDQYDPNVIYRIANHTTIDELGYHDERDLEMHMNKMKSSSLHTALDKKKINIVLPGVLNFYEDTVFVGEQIMINLPRGGNDLDKVTSGPFVVLEVKHKFSENKYSQAMTCSKLTNSTDKTLAVGPTGYTNI